MSTEAKKHKPIKPNCVMCGSNDVQFNAWAKWDVDAQDFTIEDTDDNGGCCMSCGEPFDACDWREA